MDGKQEMGPLEFSYRVRVGYLLLLQHYRRLKAELRGVLLGDLGRVQHTSVAIQEVGYPLEVVSSPLGGEP